MAKRGLGRGYSALISTPLPSAPASAPNSSSRSDSDSADVRRPADQPAPPVEVPIGLIDPSPRQPRKRFDADALDALAASIREQGLVQPLVVRRVGGRYELVAGERRMRALQRLEMKTAPVVIKDVAGPRVLELALVENLQRADLDPLETAGAYESLLRDTGQTHEKLAERLGVSRVKITNTLRLLSLPDAVRSLVAEGRLGEGHARALLGLANPASQLRLAKRIVAEDLSVRRVEELARPTSRRAPAASSAAEAGKNAEGGDPNLAALRERLARHLGVKVAVRDRGGRGVIEIHYASPEESARALRRMGLPPE